MIKKVDDIDNALLLDLGRFMANNSISIKFSLNESNRSKKISDLKAYFHELHIKLYDMEECYIDSCERALFKEKTQK